jgi:GT2 family glycosyltransferase
LPFAFPLSPFTFHLFFFPFLMSIQADLSICTFIRKPSSTLKGFLKSLYCAADPVSIEVILVDMSGGSAEPLLADFPELILYDNPGGESGTQAKNRALELATSRYLAVWEHDVYPHPDCFTKIISFLDDTPDIGIAGPQVLNANDTPEPTCRQFPSPLNLITQYTAFGQSKPARLFLGKNSLDDFSYNSNLEVDWLCSGVHVIRRELYDEIGHFDESLGLFFAEIDYYRRSRKEGWHNFFCHEARVVHANPGKYHHYLFNTAPGWAILHNYLKYSLKKWLLRAK